MRIPLILFMCIVAVAQSHSVDYQFAIAFNINGTEYSKIVQYNYIDEYENVLLLISPDFNGDECTAINAYTDAQLTACMRPPLGAGPSLAYNCFAYMLGYSGYWINDPTEFLEAGWESLGHSTLPNPFGTIVVQSKRAGSEYEPIHGSKHFFGLMDPNDPPGWLLEGKLGYCAVYKGGAGSFAAIYSTNRNYYYKPDT